jgi:hypothetical protein
MHFRRIAQIQPVLITAGMSLVTGLNYKRGVASARSRQAKIYQNKTGVHSSCNIQSLRFVPSLSAFVDELSDKIADQ